MTTTKLSLNPRGELVTVAVRQIWMLAAEFLLGMVVNLIDISSATSGIARSAYKISLVFHILIAIGLLVGAIVTVRQSVKVVPLLGRLAWAGLTLIVVTFAAGVLAMELKNDWWSFVMAVGFIASFLVYGAMLLRSKSLASS